MKASELLRKGCSIIPTQAFRAMWNKPGLVHTAMLLKEQCVKIDTACALGTIVIAKIGAEPKRIYRVDDLFNTWAWVSQKLLGDELVVQVASWNDDDCLTREEIADKLEEMGQ